MFIVCKTLFTIYMLRRIMITTLLLTYTSAISILRLSFLNGILCLKTEPKLSNFYKYSVQLLSHTDPNLSLGISVFGPSIDG